MRLSDERRNNLATGEDVTSKILAFLRGTAEDLGKSRSGSRAPTWKLNTELPEVKKEF